MKNIFWKGYCSVSRIEAISEIERIIGKYGFIIDFKQFSDVSLSLSITIEECRIDLLYKELYGYIGMDDFDVVNSSLSRERSVFVNITFAKGTGKLKIEVPAVPG